MKPFTVFLVVSIFFSCGGTNKEDHLLIPELTIGLLDDVKIIGHKGSGDSPNYGYLKYQSNSYESVKNAFELVDGSEIDLQISRDLTLWLHHDFTVMDCSNKQLNISNLNDEEIDKISRCSYGSQIINLTSFISKLNTENYKSKILSLDMKLLENPEAAKLFKNRNEFLSKVNEGINEINQISFISLQIEVSNMEDYNYFKDNNNSDPYLLVKTEEDLKQTKPDLNFSYDLNLFSAGSSTQIVGNKSQIWTANTVDELLKAISYNPNYIQTDNISLGHFFKKMTIDNTIANPLFFMHTYGTKDEKEYLDIFTLNLDDFDTNFILKLSFNTKEQIKEGLLVVYSSKNSKGEAAYWTGDKISFEKENYYSFINLEKLKQLDCKELKVYIWNTNKQNFQLFDYSINQLVLK